MRGRLALALAGAMVAAVALVPAAADADVVTPEVVKPQVVTPQVVSPASAPAATAGSAPAPAPPSPATPSAPRDPSTALPSSPPSHAGLGSAAPESPQHNPQRPPDHPPRGNEGIAVCVGRLGGEEGFCNCDPGFCGWKAERDNYRAWLASPMTADEFGEMMEGAPLLRAAVEGIVNDVIPGIGDFLNNLLPSSSPAPSGPSSPAPEAPSSSAEDDCQCSLGEEGEAAGPAGRSLDDETPKSEE